MSDRTARFHRQFDMPQGDEGHRLIWPAGWAGQVTLAAAIAAFKGGAADIEPPLTAAELDGQVSQTEAIEIPAQWDQYSAAELVDLANRLGAGNEVKTKAAAGEYVARIAAEREATQKSLV